MSLHMHLDTKLQEEAVRDGNCNSKVRCTQQSDDNTRTPQQHTAPGLPWHRERMPDRSNLRMKGFILAHSIRDGWWTWHESRRKIWSEGLALCSVKKRGEGEKETTVTVTSWVVKEDDREQWQRCTPRTFCFVFQGKEAWFYLSRLTFIAGGTSCYCRMEKRQLQEQSIWQGRRVEPGLQAEGLVYGRSNRTSMAMGGEGRGQQDYSACSSDGHPTSRLSVVSSMGSLPYLYPH